MKKPIVSIVLPSYNEANCLPFSLNKIIEFIKQLPNYVFEIVVVNDGSKDNTETIIKTDFPDIKLVSYTPNRGKGGAVKEGLSYSASNLNADYIIFMDVDLSTDLKAIPESLSLLEEGQNFVVGSRYDKESNILIKQPLRRRFISKMSRIIISTMFRFKLKDTQCGFKAMTKDVAKLLVEKSKMNAFSFDVEHLYIAKLNGITFKSLPVVWSDDRESKVSPIKSSIRFFKDLFKIKRNKKWYKNDKNSAIL